MVTYIRGKRAKARFPLQEKKELSAFQYRKADQWDAEGADTKNVGQRWTIAPFRNVSIYERSVIFIATIGIRLLPQEKDALAAIARRTDTTISQILRLLIRNYINTHGERAVEKENVYESIRCQGLNGEA